MLDKRIVITGGSSGIGYALAQQLLQQGASVFILSRRASECDLGCPSYDVDLRDLASIRQAAEAIHLHPAFQQIDALVNAAGVGFGTPLATLSESDYDAIMQTNVRGLIFMTQSLLPFMANPSVICNISSIAGVRGFTEWGVYCASKFAVEGFSKSLRQELRPRGIKVMVVRPGAVDTPLYHFLPSSQKVDFMQPETIASLILPALFLEPNACTEELLINNAKGDL